MSFLSALGTRPNLSTFLPAAPAGGKAASAQTAPASGNVAAQLPVVEPAAAASDNVSLSSQALAARAASLGASTVDYAQRFIDNFAATLFGDQAKGATLRFDTASVSAEAGFSASATGGTALLSLSESAHFSGTGQIVTADGQTYQFTIDVQYDANLQASSGQPSQPAPQADSPPASQSAPSIAPPDLATLTGKALPAIEFPGSLADLFQLLERELRQKIPNNQNGAEGNLTLRLQRLVNSAALLAPRAQSGDPKTAASDASKALAKSYAAPAATPTSTEIAAA
ncbi:MAG TPA: hypothetical protein VFG03_01515 [Telluria sp.]|nr:hypothetical protein [Telluria sp.]